MQLIKLDLKGIEKYYNSVFKRFRLKIMFHDNALSHPVSFDHKRKLGVSSLFMLSLKYPFLKSKLKRWISAISYEADKFGNIDLNSVDSGNWFPLISVTLNVSIDQAIEELETFTKVVENEVNRVLKRSRYLPKYMKTVGRYSKKLKKDLIPTTFY